jgi:endothelin-converting enzyme/putative endopeptidase
MTRSLAASRTFLTCFVLSAFCIHGSPAQDLAARSAAGFSEDTPSQQTIKQLKGLDISLLDPKAGPCDNFYQYACGGWLQQNPIPADRSRYGRDSELEEQNILVLKAILEKAAAGGADRTPNEQKIGDAYATCMDTAAIDKDGLAPLQIELDAITAVQSKQDLPELVAIFSKNGVQPFFTFRSDQDAVNASEQIAEVDQPRLGLPERGYYLRTDEKSKTLRDQYVKHIANMLGLTGEPVAQAATDAQAILAFETELAKASLSNEQRRDPKAIYHRLPLASFEAQTPAFSMAVFLKNTDAPAIESLNVTSPPYFTRLNQLIASTDLATLKTYLRWRLIHGAPVLALPQNLDAESFHFYGQTLSGQPEQQARWKRCVNDVDRSMGEALGQVYVAQRFSPADKERTKLLAADVEAAMGRDIDQLPWMSPATKVQAKQKLHAVANKIGYPDKWRDYSSLTIVRGDALGNAWRARAFAEHRNISKIGQPIDRGEWDMSPPTVNAYYNPQMNDVNFPAGILQPPYFDETMDDAVNYGDAGGVIGHELTHGFDDEGRQFDAQGNLKDWWTAEDAKKFTERADCVVNEYNGFVAVDDLHVNGRLTLGENLADLGGLRIAYLAYMQRAQQNNIDLLKRTDGFTPVQRFFLSYAQGWCEGTRPAAMRLGVQTDPHSPEEFRVNGVVVNLPEFQQAFSCTAKQPMVAKTRCSVW